MFPRKESQLHTRSERQQYTNPSPAVCTRLKEEKTLSNSHLTYQAAGL